MSGAGTGGATITVVKTTLFHVAALYLGDATLWQLIAAANGISDPVILGTVQLVLPLVPSAVQTTATLS